MPKSEVSKKKLFRDSSRLNQRYVKRNYLKNLRRELVKEKKKGILFQTEIYFLLWAYDLEFWTLEYAAKNFGYSANKIGERIVYPLVKEDHLFREETKYNYRVRYAITQKARMFVQAFYRKLEGD